VWRMLRKIGGNAIIVDADGIGRVAVGLLEMTTDKEVAIIAFPGSDRDSVAEPRTFFNRRHEGHWLARQLFEKGHIIIANIPEQREELASVKMVTHGRGFIAVEKKVDLKERINRSPGYLDNIIMMAGAIDEVPILYKKETRYKMVPDGRDDYPFNPMTC